MIQPIHKSEHIIQFILFPPFSKSISRSLIVLPPCTVFNPRINSLQINKPWPSFGQLCSANLEHVLNYPSFVRFFSSPDSSLGSCLVLDGALEVESGKVTLLLKALIISYWTKAIRKRNGKNIHVYRY